MKSTLDEHWRTELAESGFTWIRSVLDIAECQELGARLDEALSAAGSTLRNGDQIYGARNLLDVAPASCEWIKRPSITDACETILGPEWGLVRGLYFDKPPGSSWSLPWHQDLTIAVKNNKLPSTEFRNPTRKAGIDHLEAPTWLLEQMMTLRLHLDDMTSENGPLMVRAGSHRAGKLAQGGVPSKDEITELHCMAGDCLVMRPLLSHSSRNSLDGCAARRRVIHLEFAACQKLPEGIEWHLFR